MLLLLLLPICTSSTGDPEHPWLHTHIASCSQSELDQKKKKSIAGEMVQSGHTVS